MGRKGWGIWDMVYCVNMVNFIHDHINQKSSENITRVHCETGTHTVLQWGRLYLNPTAGRACYTPAGACQDSHNYVKKDKKTGEAYQAFSRRPYLECLGMILQVVRMDVVRLWSTYLHLWSALSSSGVSLSKYWNAIFTSSMKSWKIHLPCFYKWQVAIINDHDCVCVYLFKRHQWGKFYTCPLSPWGYFFSRSRTCGIWHKETRKESL